MIVTWPLAARISTAIPTGTEGVATVPLFNLWTIWWNAAWPSSGRGYWNAPIFAPQDRAFAMSETQPTTIIVAPIVWSGAPPAVAFNIYLLLALWLNGVATAQLLRAWSCGYGAALAGGLMVQWLPYVHWQLGVLQLLPLFGEAWTLLALKRFLDSPSSLRGAWLGAAFGLAYLTCHHHGLFFAVLLVIALPCVIGRVGLTARFWGGGLIALMTAGMLTAPPIVVQQRLFRQRDFGRPRDVVVSLSLQAADYSVAFRSPVTLPHGSTAERARWWPMSPGWIKLLLAVVGVVAGLWASNHRRWIVFLIVFLTAAFWLSLGPDARWKWIAPYDALRSVVPGFEHVRNVHRFALFAQLAVAWLAALGLNAISSLASRRQAAGAHSAGEHDEIFEVETPSGSGRRWSVRVGVAMLALAACGECWPMPQAMSLALPVPPSDSGWIHFLRTETPADARIACFPMPAGVEVEDFEIETWWMYFQTFHRREMVNGYSGYFPEEYLRLRQESPLFPRGIVLQHLQDRGVTIVVVDRRRVSEERLATATRPGLGPRLVLVHRDEQVLVDLYRIESDRHENQ